MSCLSAHYFKIAHFSGQDLLEDTISSRSCVNIQRDGDGSCTKQAAGVRRSWFTRSDKQTNKRACRARCLDGPRHAGAWLCPSESRLRCRCLSGTRLEVSTGTSGQSSGPGRSHQIVRASESNSGSNEDFDSWRDTPNDDLNAIGKPSEQDYFSGMSNKFEDANLEANRSSSGNGAAESRECSLRDWIKYHNDILDRMEVEKPRDQAELKSSSGKGVDNGSRSNVLQSEGTGCGRAEDDENGCAAVGDEEMMEALRVRLQQFVERKDDVADYLADEMSEDLLTMEDMERMLSKEVARKLVEECYHYVMDAFGRMETNLAGLELLAKRRTLHRLAEKSQMELVNAALEFIEQLKVAYTRVQLNKSNPLNKEVVRRVNAHLLAKNTNWVMTYSDWERRLEKIRMGLGMMDIDAGPDN